MSNFPAGSKIIITNADRGEAYSNGDIFTVVRYADPGVHVRRNGGVWYVARREFEAYTEPKFKVGDKVVVQANPGWAEEGQTGVIERVDLEDTDLPYDVKGDAGWGFWMREQDLKLVKEYTFADIKKGDTIRAEYTQNGIKHTREGVAHEGYTGWSQAWATKEGDYVAHDSWKGATYTLLERPEPPKPNPFASLPLGTLAKNKRQVWQKSAANQWRALYVHELQADCGVTDEDALREEWKVIFNPLTA